MNLCKTLVGFIFNDAIAIAIYTVLKTQMLLDASWFPIVTGLLTGLGVRQAHKSLTNNVSYMRGAVAGIIAALAILGAEEVVKLVLTTEAATTIAQAPPVVEPEDDDESEVAEAPDDIEVAPEEPMRIGPRGAVGERSNVKPTRDDMWPFIFMAVGIFLAYELARGSAGPHVASTEPVAEPTPGEAPPETSAESSPETAPDEPPREDQANA